MQKHPFRWVIAFIVLGLMGFALIPRLSVDLLPKAQEPSLYVSYSLPQAAPDIIEQSVTAPLENMLSEIEGIKKIKSVSNYNGGNITLEFDSQEDLDFKKFEVNALIRRIYPQLPRTLSYPQVERGGGTGRQRRKMLLLYSINAPLAAHEIQKKAQEILQMPLRAQAEVEEVTLSGAEPLGITVSYPEDRLQLLRLTKNQLIASLQQASSTQYLGQQKNAAGQYFFIKNENTLQNLRDWENISILRPPSDSLREIDIRLGEVAKIYFEEEEAQQFFRINGLNSVSMAIYARSGSNALALSAQIKAQIKTLEKNLPKGYQILLEYDDSEYLDKELQKIYHRTGLSLLILMLFVLLAHRKGKHLLILFSSLALNVSLALMLVYFLKIQIHLYSLAGLSISLGLIMDNVIVMLDHLQKRGNTRIFNALLGASLTTIAALMLVFWLPEEDKQNLWEFALIIALNLGVSLLIALFFTPALYQLLYSPLAPKGGTFPPSHEGRVGVESVAPSGLEGLSRLLSFLIKYRKLFNLTVLLMFGLPVFLLPSKWEGQEWYNQSIGTDFYQEEIRPYVDKILGGTLRLFVNEVYERGGYRSPEKTMLYVNAEMPYGTTPEQMNDIIQKVEGFLQSVEGIDKFVTRVSSGQSASLQISFQSKYEKSSLPYQLKNQLIARSLDWGGVGWSIYGVGDGFSNANNDGLASFRVEMRGYNYDELEKQANILAQKLLAHKRIQTVNINERLSYREKSSEEFVLEFIPEKMALLHTNRQEVIQTLQQRGKTTSPSIYVFYQDEYLPVWFKEQNSNQFSKFFLDQGQLQTAQSPLKPTDFSEIRLQKTINALHKENRQYIRTVGYDYFGSPKFGKEYLDEVLAEMRQAMPIGYTAEHKSFSFGFEQAKRQYSLLLLLLVAVFFICAILFESLKTPFLIISTIPVSYIGIFFTFGWFNFYFDQGGYAAFVLLGGIVVNASIFILHDFHHLPKTLDTTQRTLQAVKNKALPILLTTLSTVLGLVPFLTEGDSEVFWFSLAAGAIGGLVFSMFAVFVCLPVWMGSKTPPKAARLDNH